jgi:hypothetical protein
MYVGRIVKETNDTREVTVDLTRWLDNGELVGRVSVLPVVPTTLNSVALNTGTWQLVQDASAPPVLPSPPPLDTTPLVIIGASVESNGTQVSMLLASGTPGLAYTASLLAIVQGRQKELDVLVIVTPSLNQLQPPGGPPPMTQIVAGSTALPLGFAGLAILQNATNGPITVTLPPAPSLGQAVHAADDFGNAGTYTVNFQSADGSPIVNAPSFSFTANFQSATFRWTGSRWSL